MKSLSGTLRRCLTKRGLCLFLAGLLLLSLVPLLALSFYSYPAVDDFSYGLYTHHAWVETGSLIKVLKYAVGEVKDTYQNWQGTYAAVGLFSLHPGIFGEQWYFLTAFFILGALIAGSAGLCRVLVYDLLGGDRYDWGIVTSMLLLLSIQCMPSLSQGIYWFNGGSFYLFFHAAMLLYLASMLRLCLGRVHPLRIGWCALLGVALGGGNYASALLSLELSALLLCFALLRRRRSALGQGEAVQAEAGRRGRGWAGVLSLLLPVLLLVTGFAFSALAPGNAVRAAVNQGLAPVESVLRSIVAAAGGLLSYLRPLVLVGLLLVAPVLFRLAKRSGFAFRWPGVVAVLSFLLFASAYTPTMYALGSSGPPRLHNLHLALLLLLLMGNEAYLLGWLARRAERTGRVKALAERASQLCRRGGMLFYGLLMAGMLALLLAGGERPLASAAAVRTFTSGEAAAFRAENEARFAILNGPGDEVAIKPLAVRPALLYLYDIDENANGWSNHIIAVYYYKTKVHADLG